MTENQCITLHKFGDRETNLTLDSAPLVEPGPHQIIVETGYAPINPADLNIIEGTYGERPELPAVMGMEGAGIVRETGNKVKEFRAGDTVTVLNYLGTWSSYITCDQSQLIKIPDFISLEQASMLKVNPPTAWRLLHDVVALKEGDWIIQNAANSAVGQLVIQIAASRGIRTVNVVRRQSVVSELESLGADMVLVEDGDLSAAVAQDLKRNKIALGLNAVGGTSARNLAKSLAPGGHLVTYGAMSREPLSISNGLLIFKNLRFSGFWISAWYKSAPPHEHKEMFDALFALYRESKMAAKVDSVYPLQSFAKALKRTEQSGRNGKVLLAGSL